MKKIKKAIIRLRFYDNKKRLIFLIINNEIMKIDSSLPPVMFMDKKANCALIKDYISEIEAKHYTPYVI